MTTSEKEKRIVRWFVRFLTAGPLITYMISFMAHEILGKPFEWNTAEKSVIGICFAVWVTYEGIVAYAKRKLSRGE